MDDEYLLQLRTKTGKNPTCSAHYESRRSWMESPFLEPWFYGWFLLL